MSPRRAATKLTYCQEPRFVVLPCFSRDWTSNRHAGFRAHGRPLRVAPLTSCSNKEIKCLRQPSTATRANVTRRRCSVCRATRLSLLVCPPSLSPRARVQSLVRNYVAAAPRVYAALLAAAGSVSGDISGVIERLPSLLHQPPATTPTVIPT